MRRKVLIILGLIFFSLSNSFGWGFFSHKRINRMAVFSLPPEMIGFYKYHIDYLTEKAVNPDRRRYAVDGEAPRHFIDLDDYGDSAIYKLPKHWKSAVERYTEDTLNARGIVPWHINFMKYRLTEAFKAKDVRSILLLSADIGHYIGDANVPLHTTSNYNGQKTNQVGIHGFWETRLPELYSDDYDFFTGLAVYVQDPQEAAWSMVKGANSALDSVLRFEKELTNQFSEDKKYVYEQRGAQLLRTYSKEFSKAYHSKLNGQVERQMLKSIKSVSSFWYTAWVDAGQPDLNSLINPSDLDKNKNEIEEDNKQEQDKIKSRPHESFLFGIENGCTHLCCHDHHQETLTRNK